jgi:hypothetical protein
MKKILIYFLMLVLVLGVIGCGAKEKLEQKVGEAFTEKLLEEATDGDVDVDVDDGVIIFKGDDGEELVLGGDEWPESDLTKNIPEFEKGNFLSAMEAPNSVTILFDSVKKEDFTNYLEKIKVDYTKESSEISADGNIMYSASNGKGIVVVINYLEGGVSISVTEQE